MGEYATRRSDGEHVKIGTCEDMYYLRYDQRQLVQPEAGNVDPVKDAAELRFRFPWPDEDAIEPGGLFHDYDFDRSLPIKGFAEPAEGVEHYSSCNEPRECTLVRTKYRPDLNAVVPILKCSACGAMWREEERSRIEEMAVLLRSHGNNPFYHTVADRLLALAGLATIDEVTEPSNFNLKIRRDKLNEIAPDLLETLREFVQVGLCRQANAAERKMLSEHFARLANEALKRFPDLKLTHCGAKTIVID